MTTVKACIDALGLEVLNPGDTGREITGGYCGDLLSWVMGRARSGDAWITVMGNVNSVAVAVLADAACLLLAEASPLDGDALARAKAQDVCILRSDRTAYQLALELGRLLQD